MGKANGTGLAKPSVNFRDDYDDDGERVWALKGPLRFILGISSQAAARFRH